MKISDLVERYRMKYMVMAASVGHDLGSWEPFNDERKRPGYQATCSRCHKCVEVLDIGGTYMSLGDACED